MSILFSHPKPQANKTEPIAGMQINESVRGKLIPIHLGVGPLGINLISQTDWLATRVNDPAPAHSGKGLGGGGGDVASYHYTYSTALEAALCFGPQDHIATVFVNGGQIVATQIAETHTVPGGGGVINLGWGGDAQSFIGVHHVRYPQSYSQAYNDYIGGSGTLSGSYPVGAGSGDWTDNGDGTVTAGSGLGGKTVTITYSVYTGALTEKQEIVVPAGHTWTVPNTSTYLGASVVVDADTGVRINGPGAGPSGLAAGTYWVDNSGHFTFATADTGRNFIITWTASTGNSTDAPTTLNFESTHGALTQSPFAYYTTAHADMALHYPGICKIQSSRWSLGASGSLPQIQFEAISQGLAAGYLDCNPCTIFSALLTNPVYGLNFPSANIGFVADPLLDSSGLYTAISRTADFQHNAFDWFQAHSYFVTATIDNQSTVANIMEPILEAGQCVPVFSEGLLKLRPYGDTSIAGNGSIYQPDTQPMVDIDTSDIIGDIQIERSAEDGNVFDRVQVEFKDRANAYQQDTVVEDYPGSYINRTESPQSWHFIRSHSVAQWAANLRVKRANNIRTKYTFTLVSVYTYLEPMDLITLTDVNLGLVQVPVRLTSCKYQHGVGIECEAESFPYGIAKPTLLPKQASLYDDPDPASRAPGSSVPLILELPPAIIDYTSGSSHTARIYADPTSATGDWGGCQVQFSVDGVSWESLGTINSQAVVGTLNTTLNVGTGDPDTQSFNVTLNSTEQIFDASTFDFANKRENTLLALVDGSGNVETMAYHNATLIGDNQYTLANFHRALYGTTRRSFASGTSKMIKLDQGHVTYTYPDYLTGQTVHVKLMSFNSVGARLESFDAVTTYNFTLTGDFTTLLDPSGLVVGLHALAYKDNVDLATTDVLNKTANHITYVTGGVTVDSLKPAEAGAEVTTGKSLDILADGSTYARPLASRISSGKPLIDFSESIHVNKNVDNIADGSTYARTTGNQVTGAGRAYTNIASDNTYSTIPYHGSAFRRKVINSVSSSISDAAGTFETVSSYVLNIPSGFSQYKGTMTLSHTGATPSTAHGRLKIGSLTSNVIDGTTATGGPKFPTAATGSTGAGTKTWSNPTNIEASGSGTANAVFVISAATSKDLIGTGFGFALSSTSIIHGIQLDVLEGCTNSAIFSDTVRLLKAGTPVGNNKAGVPDAGVEWNTPASNVTYGASSSDLWGTTWTPSDINNANFGAVLVCSGGGTADTATVDYFQITVFYSDPAVNSGIVTVTGITGGTQVTVEVQIKQDGSSSGTDTATFSQVEYVDQDVDNLS